HLGMQQRAAALAGQIHHGFVDDACQPLNEAAAAAATGEKPGFWTRMRLLDAVPACEAATRRLEKLLSIEPPR
ncbi:MAG: hypothetical protein ACKN9T_19235, partial [Candidatus Methylumidiphilus sp.]